MEINKTTGAWPDKTFSVPYLFACGDGIKYQSITDELFLRYA